MANTVLSKTRGATHKDASITKLLFTEDGEILTTGSHIKVTSSNPTNLIGFELTIYDDDGVTPILIYDLQDRDGVPSSLEVFKRIPQ